jgi:uncharacterized membrane protein
MEPEEKSSLGIDVDLACVLCYVAGPLSGGLMLLLEKRDLLIRFHAVQSCLLFAPSAVLVPLYFLLPVPDSAVFRFLYYMIGGSLVIATIVLFIWIVPAAWRMERRRLPIVGRMADGWIPDDGRAEAYNITGADPKTPAVDLSQVTFAATPPVPDQPDTFIALIPAGLSTKEAVLDRIAAALKFPESFGRNWDALDECLADLSWIPEKRIVIFHPDLPLAGHPTDLKTYVSCLGDAVGDWKSKGRTVEAVFPPSLKEVLVSAMGGARQSHVQSLDHRTKT